MLLLLTKLLNDKISSAFHQLSMRTNLLLTLKKHFYIFYKTVFTTSWADPEIGKVGKICWCSR